MDNKVNAISVFFSTIYNKAYYIASALTIALMMEFITSASININSSIIYWLAFIVYIVAMVLLYIICKILRKKHGRLEVKQLDRKYITVRIVIMLAYTMVATILISIIHVLVLIKLIIR